MIYPLTFFTDNLPEGVGGRANGPVIRIKPKYREDAGIYHHELTHVKQFFETLGLHLILYPLVRSYRMWSEAQAYAEQMRWPDRKGACLSLEDAAAHLSSTHYKLNITQEQAIAAITKEK